jgi:hypothetical protein
MTNWAAKLDGDIRDLADQYYDRQTRQRGPGLYVQLRQATGRGGSGFTDGAGRTAPGSRPPGRLGIIKLCMSIEVDSRTLYRQFGGQYPPADTRAVLRRLPDRIPTRELERVARQVGKWHTAARTALTWLAPVMSLNVPCPYCGSNTLRTRSDASTDVWCGNDELGPDDTPLCENPETEREYRWPRAQWTFLLLQLAQKQTEETG